VIFTIAVGFGAIRFPLPLLPSALRLIAVEQSAAVHLGGGLLALRLVSGD
jgi:hypothetical protein